MAVNLDWEKLTFSSVPTHEMFRATSPVYGEWSAGEFVPYGPISLSPAAGVINYGQGIFEGLKAHRTKQGDVVLFRPEDNAKRFASGAERLCMPPFPEDQFVAMVEELVRRNLDFIPPYGLGSLYIRPIMFGSGPVLGLAPAPENTLLIYCSPVGAYFKKKGQQPIRLIVSTDYHRSAAKGMGSTKYIGNYAGEMYHSQKAKADGFNGCIYLDARNEHFIEEVGAANFFCVKGQDLLTPSLGSVLPGITRDSIMALAETMGMKVRARGVSIDEMLEADECFCTGTAAVIAPIGEVSYLGKQYHFNKGKVGEVTQSLYEKLTAIQLCEAEDPFNWVHSVSL